MFLTGKMDPGVTCVAPVCGGVCDLFWLCCSVSSEGNDSITLSICVYTGRWSLNCTLSAPCSLQETRMGQWTKACAGAAVAGPWAGR